MSVSSFETKDYDNRPRRRLREKKAKQSQTPALGAKSEAPGTKILKDSNRREMPVPQAHLMEHDFKKQTQFAADQNDTRPAITKAYGDYGKWRRRKNKPKQSQFEPISRSQGPQSSRRPLYCTGGRQHPAKILIGWLTAQSLKCSICILQAAHSVRTFLVGDSCSASFRLPAI